MNLLSNVPAPTSVKLVKALLLATGLIAVLGGIAAHPPNLLASVARWALVAAGAVSIIVAIAIKHGYGRRRVISAMLLVVAACQLLAVVSMHQPVGLFGLLIPAALLLWINTPAARDWFDRPSGTARGEGRR